MIKFINYKSNNHLPK